MGARFTTSSAFRPRSVMPGSGNGDGGHGIGFGPNLTPMVDVVMVILIFFMAAASFLGPEWFLRASLPAPSAAQDQADLLSEASDPILLPAMRLTVVLRVENGQTVAEFEGSSAQPLEQFIKVFRAAAPGLLSGSTGENGGVGGALTISPEGGVSWEDVIKMHEAASEAGFARVRLE